MQLPTDARSDTIRATKHQNHGLDVLSSWIRCEKCTTKTTISEGHVHVSTALNVPENGHCSTTPSLVAIFPSMTVQRQSEWKLCEWSKATFCAGAFGPNMLLLWWLKKGLWWQVLPLRTIMALTPEGRGTGPKSSCSLFT